MELMERSIALVRGRFPRAEAEVRGGTGETPALGCGSVVSVGERWVVVTENDPGATLLGEGATLEAAWADAAKHLR